MDSEILSQVIAEMRSREQVGKLKYGCTMDRKDLTTAQWLVHMKQELMDGILYLQKLENIQNGKTT